MHSSIFPPKLGALVLSASSARDSPHHCAAYSSLYLIIQALCPLQSQGNSSTSLSLQPASLQLALCHLPPTGLSTCLPFTSISPIVVRHSRAVTDIIQHKCAALLWDSDLKKKKKKKNLRLIQMYTQRSVSHTRLASHA